MAREETLQGTVEQLDVLVEMCHAFASTSDEDEAKESTIRWIATCLDDRCESAKIFLADRSGRLLYAEGRDGGRAADTSARRSAFTSRRETILVRGDSAIALFPMVSRGDAVGLIEIVGPHTLLEERWRALRAVTSQAAIVFRGVRQRESDVVALQRSTRFAETARDIALSTDIPSAAQKLIAFWSRRTDSPAAAYLQHPSGDLLIGAEGIAASEQATLSTTDAGGARSLFEHHARCPRVVRIREVALVLDVPDDAQTDLSVLVDLLDERAHHIVVSKTATGAPKRADDTIKHAAHEFRNPLAGARAAVELVLAKEDLDADRTRDLLERSAEDLRRLTSLVDEVLGEGAVMSARVQRVTLAPLASEAVSACSSAGADERVRLTVEGDAHVEADPDAVRSAIANVVHSALRYAQRQSVVDVSVRAEGSLATVTVKDGGPSVEGNEEDKVFEPFFGAGTGTQRGNGMGLYVAQRSIQRYGGQITVRSLPGRRHFRLEFPAAETAD